MQVTQSRLQCDIKPLGSFTTGIRRRHWENIIDLYCHKTALKTQLDSLEERECGLKVDVNNVLTEIEETTKAQACIKNKHTFLYRWRSCLIWFVL